MILTIWLSASLVPEINFHSLFFQPASVGKVDLLCKQPLHILLLLALLCLPGILPRASSHPAMGCGGPGRKAFPPARPVAASVCLDHLQVPAVTRAQSPSQFPTPDFPLLSWGQKHGVCWQLTAHRVPPRGSCVTVVSPTCTTRQLFTESRDMLFAGVQSYVVCK